MATLLKRQIKMYKEMISDTTGNPATGEQLLEGIASRWQNMYSAAEIFDDEDADEAKKFVQESRMKNA